MQQTGSSTKRAASFSLSSDFGKKSRLDITDGKIATLSERLNKTVGGFPQFTAEQVPTVQLAMTFREVASYLLGAGHTSKADKCWWSYESSIERINSLSHAERIDLASIWVQARNSKDWAPIVNHRTRHLSNSLLQGKLSSEESSGRPVRIYTRDSEDQAIATEKSWVHHFEGRAAEALWDHIAGHFRPSDKRLYAPYTSIVQSSGMGKSRTVDQLAMEHFVIPLNLGQAKSTGYPPADNDVRDYLNAAYSSDTAYDRACCFLEALFEHTANILRDIKSSSDDINLVTEFRSRMTNGQKMTGRNHFREQFYRKVLFNAQLRKQRGIALLSATAADTPPNSTSLRSREFTPLVAFRKLEAILNLTQPVSSLTRTTQAEFPSAQESSSSSSLYNAPLVILAFDEAHTIAQPRNGDWSMIKEICYALQMFHSVPLFSLFLSTTSTIPRFTYATGVFQKRFNTVEPYTNLGFDHLARAVAVDGSWDMGRLTEDRHMFSLGRPLFATRYLRGSLGVKVNIIQFATAKLLNADDIPEKPSPDQVLACLSQRIPIEFNSTSYIQQESERRQVEKHMRVCLKIDPQSETMITTSSSEPILSEAAYSVMTRTSLNVPDALKSIMEDLSIWKGDRGELLVLLLLTLARDATVGPADIRGRPIKGKRCFSLVDFLYGNLFRTMQIGTSLLDQNSMDALNTLQEDFPNARLHFNHFVKVHQYEAIEHTRLLLLQGRGAAVLCASGQRPIDAINIFLMDGKRLAKDNAGLILHQVKNDSSFTSKPEPDEFESMDPYKLNILQADDPPVPIVKIFFALAASEPSLHVRRHSPNERYSAIVYEIWCAGISPHIFAPIEEEQVSTWEALLRASSGWQELYETTSDTTADLRRSVNPGAATDAGHYARWAVLS